MQADEWVDRLINAVRRRIKPSDLSAAEESSGVAPGYLRKVQGNTRGVMILKFLRICENAEIDPAEVFAEVFPTSEPTYEFGVPVPTRPVPQIVNRVRERLEDGQTEPSMPLPRHWLEWLDDLRYEKPERALILVETTLDLVSIRDLPLALGIWASTCRLLSRYEEAFFACIEGLEIVRKNDDWLAEVDILQRTSVLIVSMAANYEAALRISESAAVLSARNGEQNRLGQILVDQGTFLGCLERYDEAEQSFGAGLDLLSETERRHRVAAFQGIGLLCQLRGDAKAALIYAKQASEIVCGPFEEGKIMWLQGCAHADLFHWDEASEAFESAFDQLSRTSPIDAALMMCDHVKALLQAGNIREAQTRSKATRKLIEPLAANLIASAALRDLLQVEHESHQLTTAFVEAIRNRIEEGRRVETRRRNQS